MDQAIELLTKAYDEYKSRKSSRMALYLASEIAAIYAQHDKNEMALNFYDKICKTYRKEKWTFILKSICESVLSIAKKINNNQIAISCFVELLSYTEDEERVLVMQSFDKLFQANNEDKVMDVEIDMDTISSFMKSNICFKKTTSFLGTPISVQIALSPLALGIPDKFQLDEIQVCFSDPRYNFVIYHSPTKVFRVCGNHTSTECTINSMTCNLQFQSNECKVIDFSFHPIERADIKIIKLNLIKRSQSGNVIVFAHRIGDRVDSTKQCMWLKILSEETPIIRSTIFESLGERTVLR